MLAPHGNLQGQPEETQWSSNEDTAYGNGDMIYQFPPYQQPGYLQTYNDFQQAAMWHPQQQQYYAEYQEAYQPLTATLAGGMPYPPLPVSAPAQYFEFDPAFEGYPYDVTAQGYSNPEVWLAPSPPPPFVNSVPYVSEPYQGPTLPCDMTGVRFFVVKSFTEDSIYKSIKTSTWSSSEFKIKRYDEAYQSADGAVYLFFSANASGRFQGIAQMDSAADLSSSKYGGKFRVRWVVIKDVPNRFLKHIILPNNEDTPITASRDGQEVPLEQGIQMWNMMVHYESNPNTRISILDDQEYYETRLAESSRFGPANKPVAPHVPASPVRDTVSRDDGSSKVHRPRESHGNERVHNQIRKPYVPSGPIEIPLNPIIKQSKQRKKKVKKPLTAVDDVKETQIHEPVL